jgi:hypothetical protein
MKLTIQVKNIPPSPTLPRGAFIRSRLIRALGYFILIDVGEAYIYYNPLFSLTGGKALSITSQGYLLCCLSIIAHGIMPYGMLNFQHSLLAVVSVSAGLSNPGQWPNLFGSLSDAYTVRRFWRYVVLYFWANTVIDSDKKPDLAPVVAPCEYSIFLSFDRFCKMPILPYPTVSTLQSSANPLPAPSASNQILPHSSSSNSMPLSSFLVSCTPREMQ